MTNAQHIAEMLRNWEKTEACARQEFPEATDEEIYAITKEAMDKSLGIEPEVDASDEFCTSYHCPGDCGLKGHGYQHKGH